MLRLLNEPVQTKFAMLPNIKKGDVVQLTTNDNNICLMRSDGTAPIGVLLRKIKIVDKKTRAIKRYVGQINFSRFMLETDNYDVSQLYTVNASLFIDHDGRFTTKQPAIAHPAIGIVTACPSTFNTTLQLMWF